MRRSLVVLAIPSSLLVSLAAANAASLTSSTKKLGAGAVSTPRCTTSGLTVVQNLSGSTVASATVSGIPSSCGGGTLYVAVNTGSGSSSGSVAIPSGGGSASVTFGTPPTAATDDEIDTVVTGP